MSFGGDQSYAERVRRRPAYARYKNRKKTIRQRFQKGMITADERAILLEQAYRRYRSDPTTLLGGEDSRERLAGHLFWEKIKDQPREWFERMKAQSLEYRGGSFCGADSCAGAPVYTLCKCRCGGLFHGAANRGSLKVTDTDIDDALSAARSDSRPQSERWCAEAGCGRMLSETARAARERRCVDHRRREDETDDSWAARVARVAQVDRVSRRPDPSASFRRPRDNSPAWADEVVVCGLCGARKNRPLRVFEGLRLCGRCLSDVDVEVSDVGGRAGRRVDSVEPGREMGVGGVVPEPGGVSAVGENPATGRRVEGGRVPPSPGAGNGEAGGTGRVGRVAGGAGVGRAAGPSADPTGRRGAGRTGPPVLKPDWSGGYSAGGDLCGTVEGYAAGCRCRACRIADRQEQKALIQ